MSTLIQRIQDLATRVGQEFKSHKLLINGNAADLSALNTTTKTNLVAAVNELVSDIGDLSTLSTTDKSSLVAALNELYTATAGLIDDAHTATTTTWSSSKIATEISDAVGAAIDEITNGAPSALDTLKELADALGDDANFAATVTTALSKLVRVDASQSFTTGEQAQARANIGALSTVEIGDPDTDFVTGFESSLL